MSNRLSAGSLSGESIPEEEEGGKGGRRAECEVGEGGGESGGESGGEQGEGGGGESGGEERVRGEGEDDSRGGERRGETVRNETNVVHNFTKQTLNNVCLFTVMFDQTFCVCF